MGFSFKFTDDDIDIDIENETVVNGGGGGDGDFINPLDDVTIDNSCKFHSLNSILDELIGTRLTYNRIDNLPNGCELYKRELYDVKHQLMLEDDTTTSTSTTSTTSTDEMFKILIGEDDVDLKNGVYEGGLKSWECSNDMIWKLNDLINEDLIDLSNLNLVELGCGTSIPSLFIFEKLIKLKKTGCKLLLTDYNFEVLRLVTIPNLLINWCELHLTKSELIELQRNPNQDGNYRDGELEINLNLINSFKRWLCLNSIEFGFISGCWGRSFLKLVNQFIPLHDKKLILTSETIYSPPMLKVISELLIELTNYITILTAKDIYFGVGGSINEFINYIDFRFKMLGDEKKLCFELEKINSNLQRSIVILK
ncbi:hypothetical protein CANARDRAFT_203918 [[Candida] arabinofermentans NRRL YB-2248]|uniref:protein-histidine N-methyltransferase n=1 Tax=[Candida] arabinofermentans NRRL YB-2248 TaxID=983967 RepID=A0A1E4SU86_9ASCO|nr:hypothetical protein CANARDRAFT_203918 [[Candida] arabinofermentans NRRL YB-2248]